MICWTKKLNLFINQFLTITYYTCNEKWRKSQKSLALVILSTYHYHSYSEVGTNDSVSVNMIPKLSSNVHY